MGEIIKHKIEFLVIMLLFSISVFSQQLEWEVYRSGYKELYFRDSTCVMKEPFTVNDTTYSCFANYLIKKVPASVNINNVKTLMQTSNGDIYVGTKDSGLYIFNGEAWSQLFKGKTILSMLQAKNGDIYIGTDNPCLHLYNGTTWMIYDTIFDSSGQEFILKDVSLIKQVHNGDIYMSIYGRSHLVRYNPNIQEWKYYKSITKEYSTTTGYDLLESENGKIYLVNTEGLTVFENGIESQYRIYNPVDIKLGESNPRLILKLLNGYLCIGTNTNGLIKFDGDKAWTIYNTKNSGLSDDFITAIIQSSNGNVLIGTDNGGLVQFDCDTTWTVFNRNNSGIRSNRISALLETTNGDIYIGLLFGGGIDDWNGGLVIYHRNSKNIETKLIRK